MSREQSQEGDARSVAGGSDDASIASVAARALGLDARSLRVERLAGDASSRRFYRVARATATADGERSTIAVRYTEPFDAAESSAARLDRWCAARPRDGRLTFANDPASHVELTAALADLGIPVPAIRAIDGEDALIFVEDAGDTLLQSWLDRADDDARRAAYTRAVDLALAFRGTTPAILGGGGAAARLALDAPKLAWELDFWQTNTFDRFLSEPLAVEVADELRADCAALAEAIAARPRFVCHRDFHARNLMVLPDGGDEAATIGERLVVIDYQDARLGPGTYDVVSLLEDPYAALDQSLRDEMKRRFVDVIRTDADWTGEDDFEREYELVAAQRLVKAVGTYAYQAAVKNNSTYVEYIAPANDRARLALDRLARFDALRRACERVAVAVDATR